MASVFLIVIFILVLTYLACRYAFHKPPNFPPGPPRIPILGSYIFYLLIDHTATHKVAILLSKFYKSKILGFYLGDTPTIVAHSHEAVKEILNNPDFDGRPDLLAGRLRDPNNNRKGIFFNDGPIWKNQRRFILRYLRDFGFGRRFQELEIFINEELLELVDILKNGPKYPHEKNFYRNGQALCPYFMTAPLANCFMKILCDERITRKDQSVLGDLAVNASIFQRIGDDYGKLFSLIPWIRHIFPVTCGYKPLKESNAVIYKFVKSVVDRHCETFNRDHIRNFIDMYLEELELEQEKGGETPFALDQFILSLVDFLFPVLSAISTQTSFLFQWFVLRPDIQKRIQDEIDDVVGKGRLPSLDDRQNLHFTEASIRECLRLETLVPSNIPHKALVDTELLGYTVPRDSFVITGLYGFHNDKDIWSNPQEFQPERFLDDNGHLCLKKDISLPFGAGKRLCAGETFARNMLFLTTSTICQNFTIVSGKDGKLPDMEKTICGLIRSPPDFWVDLKAR